MKKDDGVVPVAKLALKRRRMLSILVLEDCKAAAGEFGRGFSWAVDAVMGLASLRLRPPPPERMCSSMLGRIFSCETGEGVEREKDVTVPFWEEREPKGSLCLKKRCALLPNELLEVGAVVTAPAGE